MQGRVGDALKFVGALQQLQGVLQPIAVLQLQGVLQPIVVLQLLMVFFLDGIGLKALLPLRANFHLPSWVDDSYLRSARSN